VLEEDETLKEKWKSLQVQSGVMERMLLYADAFGDDDAAGFLKELEGKLKDADPLRRTVALNALEAQLKKIYSGLPEPEPFLPGETWAHWGLGAVAALVFLLYFCFAYPRNQAKPGSLFMVGVLTGTIGVFMLLALQWISNAAAGFRVLGRGILVLIWLILVAIAFSYAAADDLSNGFLLSFLGYTAGVGLLEELTKLMPLLMMIRDDRDMSWRDACLWGLVSGAGFGVSEGIIYCTRYYNGSATEGIYLVRFISCVAMHCAWAGAAAILIWRRRDYFIGEMDWGDWVKAVFPAIFIPMVLHGLYDTLLKTDRVGWALVTGVVSCILFVFCQEREAREQKQNMMKVMGFSGR
jgi:RsiW-degrading membrane proteinase PrsW (M82 family)